MISHSHFEPQHPSAFFLRHLPRYNKYPYLLSHPIRIGVLSQFTKHGGCTKSILRSITSHLSLGIKNCWVYSIGASGQEQQSLLCNKKNWFHLYSGIFSMEGDRNHTPGARHQEHIAGLGVPLQHTCFGVLAQRSFSVVNNSGSTEDFARC